MYLVLTPTGQRAASFLTDTTVVDELNAAQKAARDCADSGDSRFVVLNGEAGVGKSAVVTSLVGSLGGDGPASRGPTVMTVDMFIRTKPGVSFSDALANVQLKNAHGVRHWRGIIIDEYGMLTGAQLEILNVGLQRATGVRTLMGGVRIIMVGDTVQLPPVGNDSVVTCKLFRDMDPTIITLTEQCRQVGDDQQEFIEFLREVRIPVFACCG
jgi:hypothetical protein